jgi:hypothetical protein
MADKLDEIRQALDRAAATQSESSAVSIALDQLNTSIAQAVATSRKEQAASTDAMQEMAAAIASAVEAIGKHYAKDDSRKGAEHSAAIVAALQGLRIQAPEVKVSVPAPVVTVAPAAIDKGPATWDIKITRDNSGPFSPIKTLTVTRR